MKTIECKLGFFIFIFYKQYIEGGKSPMLKLEWFDILTRVKAKQTIKPSEETIMRNSIARIKYSTYVLRSLGTA